MEEEPNNKKSRAHKKRLYISIRNQIEFYLSPSNIAKDRFIAKKIAENENSYIPISTFLTFNKIKSLLNDVPQDKQEEVLLKSIQSSTILEIDGNNIRSKVQDKVRDQQEIDECTIYVEQLPLNSTHDSLSSIFSKFGTISYISLPRFKKSRQLKQFGFVEFESKDSVQKCMEYFKKFDAILHCMKPDKLMSIQTYDNEEVKPSETTVASKTEENQPPEESSEKVEELTTATSSKDETQEITEETSENEQKPVSETKEVEAKKKNRKHKRRDKKKVIDERTLTIKIMRKNLWKKMRNEYLTLERQKAKEIKEELRKSTQESRKITNVKPSPRVQDIEEGDRKNCSIVNIKFRETCNDSKELRAEFRQFSYVQHVELVNGECNVRVASNASANELLTHYSGCEYDANIISGDDESEYWKRVTENKEVSKKRKADQEDTKVVKKQRRGREKLAKAILKLSESSQHIRFDNMEVN